MSVERSVFCAKGKGSCRRSWAESPASGNVTPTIVGRMDGGLPWRGTEWELELAGTGRAWAVGALVSMLSSQEERSPAFPPQVIQP